MSYCVNCGVELEKSIRKCPLCNTPVINPNDLAKLKEINSPYPENKGVVEQVSRKDMSIVVSVIQASIAVSSIVINFLATPGIHWWLLAVGFCFIVWTITVPPMIIINLKRRLYVFMNGVAICVYLGLIAMFVDEVDWLVNLGLPIAVTVIVLLEILLTVWKYRKSYLLSGCIIFGELAILCLIIEYLIDKMLGYSFEIFWSGIVSAVCAVIIIVLITIMTRSRLRSHLHRRFHL